MLDKRDETFDANGNQVVVVSPTRKIYNAAGTEILSARTTDNVFNKENAPLKVVSKNASTKDAQGRDVLVLHST